MALRRIKEKAEFVCCVAKGDERAVVAIFYIYHSQLRKSVHSLSRRLEDTGKMYGARVSGIFQRSESKGQLLWDFKVAGLVDFRTKGRRAAMRE